MNDARKRVDSFSVCIDNNISDDNEWIHKHPEIDAVCVCVSSKGKR